MSFAVLMVCTGNICRSPAAELLFRARLADLGAGSATVTSAGTSGVTGHGLDAPTALVLRELGLATGGHTARRVQPDLVGTADLILTAGAEHRSTIVQAEPMAFRRTFTMREFARLGADLPALPEPVTEAGLRARVAEVAAQRGWIEPGPPGSDEIGDPHGAGLDVARATVTVLVETVDRIAYALGLRDVQQAGTGLAGAGVPPTG